MRVEFYISTPNIENNKKIYDYIYQKSNEKIAEKFIWERGNQLKASKIFIEQKGIGIASKEQWRDAAEFLVKGIQQIDKLLIPIVEQYYK